MTVHNTESNVQQVPASYVTLSQICHAILPIHSSPLAATYLLPPHLPAHQQLLSCCASGVPCTAAACVPQPRLGLAVWASGTAHPPAACIQHTQLKSCAAPTVHLGMLSQISGPAVHAPAGGVQDVLDDPFIPSCMQSQLWGVSAQASRPAMHTVLPCTSIQQELITKLHAHSMHRSQW